MNTKKCSHCKNFKLISEFHKNSGKKGKDIQRKSDLKRNYNITTEEYKLMLIKQDSRCAICRNLSVDHNHKTGEIRGLLCTSCNRGIGFFLDDPYLLLQAKDYLLGK